MDTFLSLPRYKPWSSGDCPSILFNVYFSFSPSYFLSPSSLSLNSILLTHFTWLFTRSLTGLFLDFIHSLTYSKLYRRSLCFFNPWVLINKQYTHTHVLLILRTRNLCSQLAIFIREREHSRFKGVPRDHQGSTKGRYERNSNSIIYHLHRLWRGLIWRNVARDGVKDNEKYHHIHTRLQKKKTIHQDNYTGTSASKSGTKMIRRIAHNNSRTSITHGDRDNTQK